MIIIGIAGGTGSGKTTVVNQLISRLDKENIAVLPQDAYYRDNSQVPLKERRFINFDHPGSIEFELLNQHLRLLKDGLSIERPVYSYLTCTRQPETISIKPKKILIVEGILTFTDEELRKLCDIKVFIDTEADDRLGRVINRDISERGRDLKEVLERYETMVKPMHQQFIEPSKRFADIIIPHGGHNIVAINMLVSLIEKTTNHY